MSFPTSRVNYLFKVKLNSFLGEYSGKARSYMIRNRICKRQVIKKRDKCCSPRCFVSLYVQSLWISLLGIQTIKETIENLSKDLYTTLTTLLQEKKKSYMFFRITEDQTIRSMRKGNIIYSLLLPLKNCFLSAFLTTFRNNFLNFYVLLCAFLWFLLADCSSHSECSTQVWVACNEAWLLVGSNNSVAQTHWLS